MIKNNDIVDVIFPATAVIDKQIIDIKECLKNLNLKPRIFLEKEIKKISQTSLNIFPVDLRFKQFYQAIKNPNSSLVWCGKGGYGSGDLLPMLAKAKPVLQNKMFVGFSDITSIATFLQQNWGWKIIYGAMPIQLIENGKLKINEKAKKEILDLIFGKKNNFEYKLEPLNQGNDKSKNKINGEIVGGCLSVLCGHFGGNFQVNFGGKILFLEDIDESGEKIDRYFRQIIEVILKTKTKPKAILLGEFSYGVKEKLLLEKINQAIKNLIARIEQSKLKIPVFKFNDALGHSNQMRPLILGVESQIDFEKEQLINSYNF